MKNSRFKSLWGAALGVASGLFYGLYSIFGRYALAHYKPFTVTFYTFLFAGLGALTLMRFRLGYDLGIVLAKGIVCSMLTVFLLMPGLLTDAVIAGALMPLVPGLAMTNAVQDSLRGDMVSGLSHGAQALLTACLIAGGALLSPVLMKLLIGGGV